MANLRVELGERSYDIAITTDALDDLGPFVRARCAGTFALVVCDDHVVAHADGVAHALQQVGFRTVVKVMPAGEPTKSLTAAATLYDALAAERADRKSLVVAVGGGVIGDLAGFAAATYNRGLPFVQVPTSLLAMVDSSVGGKVGINHPKGKNLIGAFHQPVGVWIDTASLETLPVREYRSGLAEVVKYGVILDAEFFTYLEANAEGILRQEARHVEHIVARSCRLKADVVERDERELTGLRAVLNYGHTFAHAFETAAGYGTWLHGEAVAAGMVCASRLAERRGLIPAEITERQIALLKWFDLPVAPEDWPIDELIGIMGTDKKAEAGRLRFVLPVRLGEVRLFDDVPRADVAAVLASFR
ncbi:MAG: 3-dehydroquinate synthase [Gemmataceae bacterium]